MGSLFKSPDPPKPFIPPEPAKEAPGEASMQRKAERQRRANAFGYNETQQALRKSSMLGKSTYQ